MEENYVGRCWACSASIGLYEHYTIGLCNHCQAERRSKVQRPPNRAERRAAKSAKTRK